MPCRTRRYPLAFLAVVLGAGLLALPAPCRAQAMPSMPSTPMPAMGLGALPPGAHPFAGVPPYQELNRNAGMFPSFGVRGTPKPAGTGLTGAVATNAYQLMSGNSTTLKSQSPPRSTSPGTATESAKVKRLVALMHSSSGFDWPLALRILPPGPEATQLRDDIDRLAEEVRTQEKDGKVDADVWKEMRRDVDTLHRLWAARGDLLPLSHDALVEAGYFLRRLEDALR